MKRNSFDDRRDKQTANESYEDRDLLCKAPGCPNRWSVSVGGGPGYCSAHAWAHPSRWSGITEQQQWNQTERARSQKPVEDMGDVSYNGKVIREVMDTLAKGMVR
jgi:hypothetical protein